MSAGTPRGLLAAPSRVGVYFCLTNACSRRAEYGSGFAAMVVLRPLLTHGRWADKEVDTWTSPASLALPWHRL
jgi:hypothetical protein